MHRRRVSALALVLRMCGLVAVVLILTSCGGKSRREDQPGVQTSQASPRQSGRISVTPASMRLAGSSTCSATVASSAEAEARVRSAAGGKVICLAAGTYAGLQLSRSGAGDVTVQAVPGQTVRIVAGAIDTHNQRVAVVFAPGARHIVLHGLHIAGEVELQPGDSFVRIDANDISGGFYGIQLDSSNCRAANAPTWANCRPLSRITNTVISGNRIHHIVAKADALNIDNYAILRITGNDIYDLVEGGDHTDCLQSTFGGTGLVFDHNYEHDNECQGFFLKDGDVTNARFYDNLFLRDNLGALNGGSSFSTSQVYNTRGFVAERNTIWDGKGLTLRCIDSRVGCTATLDRNVFSLLTNGNRDDQAFFKLKENFNVFGARPWSFRRAITDNARRPAFLDPAEDDYRLAHNPRGIGVDWAPGDQHYGP